MKTPGWADVTRWTQGLATDDHEIGEWSHVRKIEQRRALFLDQDDTARRLVYLKAEAFGQFARGCFQGSAQVRLISAGGPLSETEARGRTLVERRCARCHAIGRAGQSADLQAPPFRRLHERNDVDALGEGLAEGLSIGHGAMREWRFDPPDVSAILAYLGKIQASPAKTTSKGATSNP